jgi:hypothetical protein
LDRCLDIVKHTFKVNHIIGEENSRSNFLVQHASGYHISKRKRILLQRPMLTAVGNKYTTLDASLMQHVVASGSDQPLVMHCKESSVRGAARHSAVPQPGVHDSVHESETLITESSSNLESVEWGYL